jgi:hypothetical protein
MGHRTIAIFMLLLLVNLRSLSGRQGSYEDVSKREASDCVLAFVANREMFQAFGCYMEVTDQKLSLEGMLQRRIESVVFEDSIRKFRRADAKRTSVFSENDRDYTNDGVFSRFHLKSKERFFENGVERPERLAKGDLGPFFVPDPWMVPLTEVGLLLSGAGGESNYWLKVLDDSNLLWAESNGKYLRGEWRFGRGEGETYVQVYFDTHGTGEMPVLVRYIRPKNLGERFAKVGRTFVAESEIKWIKGKNGYLPIEVRMKREDFWKSQPGSKLNEFTDIKFKWVTALIDNSGAIDTRVFEPGIMNLEELAKSFSGAAP